MTRLAYFATCAECGEEARTKSGVCAVCTIKHDYADVPPEAVADGRRMRLPVLPQRNAAHPPARRIAAHAVRRIQRGAAVSEDIYAAMDRACDGLVDEVSSMIRATPEQRRALGYAEAEMRNRLASINIPAALDQIDTIASHIGDGGEFDPESASAHRITVAQMCRAGCIKALSIRQPWCHHILFDGKDVENRDWPTIRRGWFLIHASNNTSEDRALIRSRRMPLGGIVGAARIVDCVTSMDSQWFMGRYGFVLRDAFPISLVPAKGALGFFTLPTKSLTVVADAIEASA